MRVLVFTKPFGRLEPGELVTELTRLSDHGVAGADLVVRAGQTVAPDEPARLEAVANGLAAVGMPLEVVTTDLLAPDATADRLLGACAAAGVRLVRAGFYRYDPALGYERCRASARERLAALAELATEHGVQLAVQLHHGTIHQSAAHLALLAGELAVAAYADPGNQLKEGSEDWRLCLDLLGERLACVGVKNASWQRDWVPLSDGIIDWPARLTALRASGYTGPLSLHIHYPVADVPAALRADVDALQKALSDSRSMVPWRNRSA